MELEEYKKAFNDHFSRTVGYEMTAISRSQSVYEMIVEEKHWNPNNIMHGGALFSVMDSGQGALVHYILNTKEVFGTTAEATIRYRKPHKEGRIVVRTTVTERKRSILYVRTEAFNEQGDLLAELTEKWMILPRKK